MRRLFCGDLFNFVGVSRPTIVSWSLANCGTLRIVSGCLRLTPADNLPILAGIQPAELRRNGATLPLARRGMEPRHLLHSALTRPSSTNAWRLKSRHPFVPAAQQLISLSDNNMYAAIWADHQWDAVWANNPTRLRTFIFCNTTPSAILIISSGPSEYARV